MGAGNSRFRCILIHPAFECLEEGGGINETRDAGATGGDIVYLNDFDDGVAVFSGKGAVNMGFDS